MLKRILQISAYTAISLIGSGIQAHATLEYIPIKSNVRLEPGQAEVITLETNHEMELGWKAIQKKMCTMHCVEAIEKSAGHETGLSTNLGASTKYRPVNGKIIIEYKNKSDQVVIINIHQVKRTCNAEACAFFNESRQSDRYLVFKIDYFRSIKTSRDQSYSIISGVTTGGKEFTVKVIWWTDNNNVFPNCLKYIKDYVDNRAPKEEYSPYILSGKASGYHEIIYKSIDTCGPKATRFSVSDKKIFSGHVKPSLGEKFDQKRYVSNAVFSLDKYPIKTRSAFVLLTDEFYSGQVHALKIRFFKDLLTEDGKYHILKGDGGGYDVAMVLFLDKEKKIYQVNLTIVLPGRTVGATVAWKAGDLRQYFSDFVYDGKRLKLKSKGNYAESNSDVKLGHLAWDIDLNLPVYNRLSPNRQ